MGPDQVLAQGRAGRTDAGFRRLGGRRPRRCRSHTRPRRRWHGELHDWADAAECFGAHPGRVIGDAYGTTFEAELARLRRTDEEPAWRTAKDTWASHEVPHHAAYAGWRLAVCLLDRGRRNDGQRELVAAYAAAEHHEPLRREIEALARRARLPLEPAPPMPDPSAAAPTGGARPAASHRASWTSSGSSGPAPVTTRSDTGSTSARRQPTSMSPTSFASSASAGACRQPWSPSGWVYSPQTTTARPPEPRCRGGA